jgi:bacterioferritin-associated ferredoxin
VAWLQQHLCCGTQCGSCLPTVKTLVQRHATSARAAQVLAP